VTVEDGQVILRGHELVRGDGHDVVLGLPTGLLVEVVADSGSVRQQVLDRHAVVDQRQIAAQDGSCGRRELEHPFLDQARDRDGKGREALGTACEPEARVDLVRDLEGAMRQAVRSGDLGLAPTIDPARLALSLGSGGGRVPKSR